ncbi:MAG: DUF2339 domain-containing protein [Candidatus Rokubacteria bacterium]|nr:DUF2339 domain-containing protein [Candidatus Rokubacteria bacterium]
MRGLLHRMWTLEQAAGTDRESPAAPVLPAKPTLGPPPPAPSPAPPSGTLDLEQRIGARWTTWVCIIAVLFGIGFFLRWSFENNLIGPAVRVILGLLAGTAFLASGLLMHRRRDLPYLSEGLAGGGLGVLYLSLYAAYALYGFVGVVTAFAAMFGVTVAGSVVAVATSRHITAVLTVLGGLLTPVLLAAQRPNERGLLGYLVVLDLLVFAIALFRSWPALNRLAWAGSALLLLPILLEYPASPDPPTRLVLLSALFLLFLAVPLVREWTARRPAVEIDLALVVANAAGYFWAVYVTLERWWPVAEAPYALALAVLYALLAAVYGERVGDDDPTGDIHLGIAIVFLTLAIPLGLDGPWITLAWAAQGAVLVSVAPKVRTPVAVWGGLAALLLATFRVLAVDPSWHPGLVPVWNLTYLVHLLVVAAFAWAGVAAGSLRREHLWVLTPEGFQSLLWALGSVLLGVLFWREPTGFWPAALLIAEVLALGALGRVVRSPAFVVATPLLALVLLARLGVDEVNWGSTLRYSLVTKLLVTQLAACAALGLAGRWLAGSGGSMGADKVGRALSAGAGVLLLLVLSQRWITYETAGLNDLRAARQWDEVREVEWRTQVGLSVLWTLYAAAAMAWGFVRSVPVVRYAALALFGLTIGKVFVVDLATISTLYRIVSFLVLGLVLLGVSFVYQKVRSAAT